MTKRQAGPASAAAGRRLREARRRAGISQAELARRAGASQAHVCNVEAGRVGLGVDTLCVFAAALGVKPESLLTEGA